MRIKAVVILLCLAAVMLLIYLNFAVFVIQPIGVVPGGRTLVVWRTGKLNFVDSADAICLREMVEVNLLCRMAVLGFLTKEGTIVARLPYSHGLYLYSTGGYEFER